jgi:hypothetical protein
MQQGGRPAAFRVRPRSRNCQAAARLYSLTDSVSILTQTLAARLLSPYPHMRNRDNRKPLQSLNRPRLCNTVAASMLDLASGWPPLPRHSRRKADAATTCRSAVHRETPAPVLSTARHSRCLPEAGLCARGGAARCAAARSTARACQQEALPAARRGGRGDGRRSVSGRTAQECWMCAGCCIAASARRRAVGEWHQSGIHRRSAADCRATRRDPAGE